MKSRRSPHTNFPAVLALAIIGVAAFSFGLGSYVSHAAVTLNGSGVTATSSGGNFLELTSSTNTLFSVNNAGNVRANEFYGSTVSATPSPDISFTSAGGLNLNAGGTNQNIDLNPTGSGATIMNNLEDEGGEVFNVKAYGAKGNGTTDDTAAVQAAINAANAAGGGTIYFPSSKGAYLIAGQLNIPLNGSTVSNTTPPGYTLDAQNSFRFEGPAAAANGGWTPPSPAPAVISFTGSAAYAEIATFGAGQLTLENMELENRANCSAFVYTTNTSLHINNVTFSGKSTGTAACNDAIILGGTSSTIGNDPTDAFQGYGTVIRDNFFDQIRSVVTFQAYANGTQVVDNTISKSCGTSQTPPSSGGAAFLWTGESTSDNGNYIAGNLVESASYATIFYLNNDYLIGNGVWDGGGTTAVYHTNASAVIPGEMNPHDGAPSLVSSQNHISLFNDVPTAKNWASVYSMIPYVKVSQLTTPSIDTGYISNQDLGGQLTLSSGTASYTFTNGPYTNAPICTATDATALNPVEVTVTSSTLTVNGTGSDTVNYICIGRY